MKKYKVKYSGYAYVKAESLEEAEELYEDDAIYDERIIDEIEEVDCFRVSL